MTSPRQVAANRDNAAKSTGPRTAAGKAVASRNATRHAILQAELAVTADEDAEALEGLRAAFAEELAPVGPLEAALVERVVSALWRLRRVQTAEVGMFDADAKFDADAVSYAAGMFPGMDADTAAERAGRTFTGRRETLAVLTRYEVALERSLYGALHELQRLQAARVGAGTGAPPVVDVELHGLPEGVG